MEAVEALGIGEILDAGVDAEARGCNESVVDFDGPDDAVGVVVVEPDAGAGGEIGEFTFGLPCDDAQLADLIEECGVGDDEGCMQSRLLRAILQ